MSKIVYLYHALGDIDGICARTSSVFYPHPGGKSHIRGLLSLYFNILVPFSTLTFSNWQCSKFIFKVNKYFLSFLLEEKNQGTLYLDVCWFSFAMSLVCLQTLNHNFICGYNLLIPVHSDQCIQGFTLSYRSDLSQG